MHRAGGDVLDPWVTWAEFQRKKKLRLYIHGKAYSQGLEMKGWGISLMIVTSLQYVIIDNGETSQRQNRLTTPAMKMYFTSHILII